MRNPLVYAVLGAIAAVAAARSVAAADAPTCGTVPVSRFWEELDGLCSAAPSPPESADPVTNAAVAGVRTYCASKRTRRVVSPIFASETEPRRMELLAKVAAAADETVDVSPRGVPEPASPLFADLVQRAAPDAWLRSGPATDLLVRQLQERVCDDEVVRNWVESVCAPLPSGGTLTALRDQIAFEALRFMATAAAKGHPIMTEPMRLLAALLLASVESVGPYRLAARLGDAVPVGGPARSCPGDRAPAEICKGCQYPVLSAARVIEALVIDGGGFSQSSEHYDRVVARILVEEGLLPTGARLSRVQMQAVRQLVTAIQTSTRLGQQLLRSRVGRDLVRSFLVQRTRVVQQAMTIVYDRGYELPVAWDEVLDGFAAADIPRMLEGFGQFWSEFPPVSRVMPRLELAARFIAARTDAERRRVLRRSLLGLKPWTERVLFDVNLGTVILDVSELNAEFAGDLTLGYNAGTLGAVVRGSAHGYEYSEGSSSSANTYRVGAALEGWLASAEDELKLELRLTGGYVRFDTDVAGEAAGGDAFSDETSDTVRGSFLAGVRFTPSPRFAMGAWGGGGAQFESYNALVVGQTGEASISDGQKLTGKVDGRLRLQAVLWPGVLVARLRTDLEWFRLSTTGFVLDANTVALTPVLSQLSYLDLETRAYIDVEVARFAGFVPSVSGGLNYLAVWGSGVPSDMLLAPAFATGIRRDVF